MGEKRGRSTGKTIDKLLETWGGGRGPCRKADVGPEVVLEGERKEGGGGAGGGGECGTVEAGQDVGFQDVRV